MERVYRCWGALYKRIKPFVASEDDKLPYRHVIQWFGCIVGNVGIMFLCFCSTHSAFEQMIKLDEAEQSYHLFYSTHSYSFVSYITHNATQTLWRHWSHKRFCTMFSTDAVVLSKPVNTL